MPVGLGCVGLIISIAVVRSLALFAGSALLVAVRPSWPSWPVAAAALTPDAAIIATS